MPRSTGWRACWRRGDDPLYVARRLVRFATEDVGLADPAGAASAMAAQQAIHFLGMPEGALALAELVVYLALAPKSNAVYRAYGEVRRDVEQTRNDPVPIHLRNARDRPDEGARLRQGAIVTRTTTRKESSRSRICPRTWPAGATTSRPPAVSSASWRSGCNGYATSTNRPKTQRSTDELGTVGRTRGGRASLAGYHRKRSAPRRGFGTHQDGQYACSLHCDRRGKGSRLDEGQGQWLGNRRIRDAAPRDQAAHRSARPFRESKAAAPSKSSASLGDRCARL